MDSISTMQLELDQRLEELDIYSSFLQNLTLNKSHLYHPKEDLVQEISYEIPHILKANAYLLLYNAVEATVSDIIKAIHSEIQASNTSFNNLNKDLKIHILKSFRTAKVNINLDNIDDFSPLEINIQNVWLSKARLFSGNLDAKAIRNLMKKYGFSINLPQTAKGGEKLKKIKVSRNQLAHGRSSFLYSGQDESIDWLINAFKEIAFYLQGLLDSLITYLDKKQYRQLPKGDD